MGVFLTSLSLLLLDMLFPFFVFLFFEKNISLTVAAVVLWVSSGSVGSLRRFSRFLFLGRELERERGVCEILGGVDHRRILEEEEEEVPEFLCLSGVATFTKTFQRWIFFPLSLSFCLWLSYSALKFYRFPCWKPRLTHLLTVLVSKRKEEKTRRGENRPGCRGPSLFLDALSRLSVFLCCEVCVVLKGAPKTLFPLKNSNIGFSLSI